MPEQYKNKQLMKLMALELKRLRINVGITQDGVYYDTRVHVARLETGKVNPSISTLSMLCKYYGISLNEFFKSIEQ